MSSIHFDGVRFLLYSEDHPPRHAHALYGETEVIVELASNGDVMIADRRDAVFPANAKKTEVRKILKVAAARKRTD